MCSLISAKGYFCQSPVSNTPGLSAEEHLGALLVFPQGQLKLEQSSRATGLGMAAGSIPGELVEGRKLLVPRASPARKMEMLY